MYVVPWEPLLLTGIFQQSLSAEDEALVCLLLVYLESRAPASMVWMCKGTGASQCEAWCGVCRMKGGEKPAVCVHPLLSS